MASKESANSSRPPRLLSSCLLLTAALAAAFPAFAYIGYTRSGNTGLFSAAVAAVVCWGSGLAALLLIGLFRDRPAVVSATFMATLLRAGLPLLLGVVLTARGGALAEAGVFGMILGYYLLTLLIDTLLSVRLIGTGPQTISKAS